MFNFEDKFLNNILAKEKPLSVTEKAVFNWHLKDKEFKEDRTISSKFEDLDEFKTIDGFSADDIEKDKQSIKQQRSRYKEQDKTERGQILESIIDRYGDLNGWFGDMVVSKTTEYDDRFNHTDFVLSGELDDGKEVFLAVDCTVSDIFDGAEKKISRITDEITNGGLTEIKYFKSSDNENDMRTIKNIPRVVLIVNSESLENLCKKVLSVVNKEEGSNNEFSRLEIHIEFLMQIISQLKTQKELFQRLKKKRPDYPDEMLVAINASLKKIEQIIEDKKSFLKEDFQKAVEQWKKKDFLKIISS